jgi:AhpD family alkylhydroperoxidase
MHFRRNKRCTLDLIGETGLHSVRIGAQDDIRIEQGKQRREITITRCSKKCAHHFFLTLNIRTREFRSTSHTATRTAGQLPRCHNGTTHIENAGVSAKTLQLAELRARQINGCSLCVDLHSRIAKTESETDERLFAVAAWRESALFSDAERAALALAEALTRISDKPDPVPDALWQEVNRHYDERSLSALLLAIAGVNVWNRLNVATRQPAGSWKP